MFSRELSRSTKETDALFREADGHFGDVGERDVHGEVQDGLHGPLNEQVLH